MASRPEKLPAPRRIAINRGPPGPYTESRHAVPYVRLWQPASALVASDFSATEGGSLIQCVYNVLQLNELLQTMGARSYEVWECMDDSLSTGGIQPPLDDAGGFYLDTEDSANLPEEARVGGGQLVLEVDEGRPAIHHPGRKIHKARGPYLALSAAQMRFHATETISLPSCSSTAAPHLPPTRTPHRASGDEASRGRLPNAAAIGTNSPPRAAAPCGRSYTDSQGLVAERRQLAAAHTTGRGRRESVLRRRGRGHRGQLPRADRGARQRHGV